MVFNQRLCLSLSRWLWSLASFSFVFQRQLLSQLLPQWGVAVWVYMLPSGFRVQLCSPPAILLWSWVFAVLVYWGLLSLPRLLSLGQGQWSVSQPLAVSMLWWFADCFLLLQCRLIWMLLTGSGDELCGPLPALFQAAAYHLPAVGPSAFPVFIYWNFMRRSAPCLPASPMCLLHPTSSVVCSFSVPCLLFSFFFCGVGVSLPSGLCWFIPGVTGGIPCGAWCSPVGLWNVSQAGLESVSGSAGALLFSQCNMAWRIFLQANSSGY
jgi:hypothetical protein